MTRARPARSRPNAALVVVDPLIEFIDGKTDAHKSQPVRQALAALNALARESTVAIVVIIHLNKGASTDPLIRHEGSAAFTQVLRGAMLLGHDPNDPEGERGSRRVLAVSSSNLAQLAPSLLYEIRTATVRGDTGEQIVTAEIACVGESDATGSDLLGTAGNDDGELSAEGPAVDFLLTELDEGPKLAKELKDAARECSITDITLRRAKSKLEVKASKTGENGTRWEWSLPGKSRCSCSGEHLENRDHEHLDESPANMRDPEVYAPQDAHSHESEHLWSQNGNSEAPKAYDITTAARRRCLELVRSPHSPSPRAATTARRVRHRSD